MLIDDLSHTECVTVLTRNNLARLACCEMQQPYLTPIHFVYETGYLYSFSMPGQKINWMRTNPLVCVEVEEISGRDDWTTVIAMGRYEELVKGPEFHDLRQRAHELLSRRASWWEPAFAPTTFGTMENSLDIVYFRIFIHALSGRRASPPTRSSGDLQRKSWLHRLF